jgi:hypothetical protein
MQRRDLLIGELKTQLTGGFLDPLFPHIFGISSQALWSCVVCVRVAFGPESSIADRRGLADGDSL